MLDGLPRDGRKGCIIVGASAVGCGLANRPSTDPDACVLMYGKGKSDACHWVKDLLGYLYCMGHPRRAWMMKTTEAPGLGALGVVDTWILLRVVLGSSAWPVITIAEKAAQVMREDRLV